MKRIIIVIILSMFVIGGCAGSQATDPQQVMDSKLLVEQLDAINKGSVSTKRTLI